MQRQRPPKKRSQIVGGHWSQTETKHSKVEVRKQKCVVLMCVRVCVVVGGPVVDLGGCGKMCMLGLSGCRVKPLRLRGRRGFTRQPENSKRAHLHPQNSTRRPPERERVIFPNGERTKSAKFLAPTLRGPPPFGTSLVGSPGSAPEVFSLATNRMLCYSLELEETLSGSWLAPPGPFSWVETDFGQTDFGRPYPTEFGQTDFRKTDFGQNRLWPNRLWPKLRF